MGFGPSGPRVLPAVQQQEQGLAQFASGIESILTKAKEQKDFTQGTETFENLVEKYTDKDGNTDFQKVDLGVASSRDITQPNKTHFHQVSQKAQEQKIAQQKAGVERSKLDKEFRQGVTAETEGNRLGEIIDLVNKGKLTAEEGASEVATFKDKDIRNAGFSELGRRTDRETRISQAQAGEERKLLVEDYSNLRKKSDEIGEAARKSLNGAVLSTEAIAKTGPFSKANLSRVWESSSNPIMKAAGIAMRDGAGQAVKEAQIQEIGARLISTFGARPAVIEFENLLSKLIAVGAPEEVNRFILDVQEAHAMTGLNKEKAFQYYNDLRLNGQISLEQAESNIRKSWLAIEETGTKKLTKIGKRFK